MEDNGIAPQLTGADLEIANTATRLSQALGMEGPQAEALRLALSDHATAVGSKSTAMIAGLFGPVFKHIEDTRVDVAKLAEQREKDRKTDTDYRTKMLNWRTELRLHIDDRFDAFGTELNGFHDEMRAFRQEYRTEVDAVKRDFTLFKEESRADRAEIRRIINQMPQSEQLKEMKKLKRWFWIGWVTNLAIVLMILILFLYGGGR
jgi:hypothetical protein